MALAPIRACAFSRGGGRNAKASLLWSACLVVVLAMGITAIGTTVATGQTELHLVALASELKEKIVDVKGNGVGVGDMAVVRERLLDATGTDQVGTAYWHGVVVRSPSNEPLHGGRCSTSPTVN